tara:strand:- start:142 stop:660 length:519 start_codon:yes stop_codon:yes gene_type:complete
VDLITPVVIDNFLDESVYHNLKELIYFNPNFPQYLQKDTTWPNVTGEEWSWYATHIFYKDNQVKSEYYTTIYDTLIKKLQSTFGIKSLIRIKSNFYPYTEEIKEHLPHTDYEYDHFAAIFSLNSCDGYTRIDGDEKFHSIDNRMLIFNGNVKHNSSTTTTDSGRFNIGLNWT